MLQHCPDAAASAPPSNMTGWWVLAVFVFPLVVDIILQVTGRETMSRWFRRKIGKHWKWWKGVGVGFIALVIWHMLLGGPI